MCHLLLQYYAIEEQSDLMGRIPSRNVTILPNLVDIGIAEVEI